ncbi:MAG: acyl-CoA dehydrogenase family protein [Desulfobacterales bacterium]|jgi:alkylation response protein AidB-like acyl-CoA dehydrogenase|nr:acyl-CoA dehydrogenase family protein [Desulfobacterales bacterium]
MEFALTRSQLEIKKAVAEFAKGEFSNDIARELSHKRIFPKQIYQKAAELGFVGIHFDEAYDGGGMGMLENALIAEELCRKDATLGSALMLAACGSECLLHFGSRELKDDFLPMLTAGTMCSGIALSEGLDLSRANSVETTAAKENDMWVINGEKKNVINGGYAGFYAVLCRTDPDAPDAKALSMILVEGDRHGLVVCDTGEKIGLRATAINDIGFEQVRVPLLNVIGREGDGMRQAMAFLNQSRVLMASIALGIMQGALDRAVSYVKQREQFGRKIAQFQITQHKIAEMAVKMATARVLTYQAAWQCDQKKQDAGIMAMARLVATRAALDVSHEAIQLLGGYGYTAEYEVERFCRDAKCLEMICDGPGILKDFIGLGVIGKI